MDVMSDDNTLMGQDTNENPLHHEVETTLRHKYLFILYPPSPPTKYIIYTIVIISSNHNNIIIIHDGMVQHCKYAD